ncbi:ABC1 kinase family protein [Solibacillus sp. FSL H8-0538]|uniref:ABC1 kinase family protein n=1 Tax=Solibacillus sp. FSL H8-0538 TaxID=2921400 RepID=UPI0030F4D42B
MKQLAFYRIVRIVWMSVKFFTQVMLFQKRHKGYFTPAVQDKWERLVTKQAREFNKTALKLEGLLIKVGQFLSTRADIMPPSFIAELEGLTDRVPAVAKKHAVSILEEEWNTATSAHLLSLSETPIASASIGEVYKGVLHNGTAVAIKIQRPHIERIIRVDFKAMRIVIWLAKKFTSFSKQIDFDLLYKDMVQIIGDELNFLQELRNGRSFAERFATMPGVGFPVYDEELSTRRVLVMEWIEGSRITDLAFLEKHHLDRKVLSERVFRLFLEQVLEGGQFHADPHGGNILVQPDGTVVLIDFGMVGSITPQQANDVLQVVKGIVLRQYDEVLDGLESLHFLLPNANRQLLADAIARMVRAYETDELKQMNSLVIDRLLADIKEIVRKEPVQLPAEFAFFGRAISTFVGVLHGLDPKVDLLAIAKPRILEWARSRNDKEEGFFSKEEALRFAGNILLPLKDLPTKLSTYLEEPTRMRQYIEQRDVAQQKEHRLLQTRLFAGMTSMLSLGVLFFAVWSGHQPLTLVSGASLLGTLWFYWRT